MNLSEFTFPAHIYLHLSIIGYSAGNLNLLISPRNHCQWNHSTFVASLKHLTKFCNYLYFFLSLKLTIYFEQKNVTRQRLRLMQSKYWLQRKSCLTSNCQEGKLGRNNSSVASGQTCVRNPLKINGGTKNRLFTWSQSIKNICFRRCMHHAHPKWL